jgi:hypothetical protein
MADREEVIDIQDNNQKQPQVINAPARGNTTFAFKVKQRKVPEFFGKKEKIQFWH